MVNNSTNINKNHLSGIVDHHAMSWSERWCLLILVVLLIITQWVEMRGDFCWYRWNCWPSLNEQKSPLTLTHWVMGNNSTNINKNHLSPQLIEWWSTILPISTKITSHLNSLSDGGDFFLYWGNCWPSLNELRWEVIFIDIGGIIAHHSMS
jgi:hypothetical protein